MTSKTILITGGAGFIGSNLTSYYLEEGNDVSVIDNLLTSSESNIQPHQNDPHFHFYNKNLIDGNLQSYLENRQFDHIFHLASPASPRQYYAHPIETLLVNSIGTQHLLEYMKQTKSGSMVYASTSEVYGDPLVHPQIETYWGNVNPNGERSCYDEAKRFGEAMVMSYVRLNKINVKIARIFNTYGPNMEKDDGRVISNFITQALDNADMTIYGDGNQTRSFCYVTDLIDGLDKLAGINDPGLVVNLGNDTEKTIVESAQLIKQMTSSTSNIVHKPLPSDDPKKRKPDLTKARQLLAFKPRVTLDEGLDKTIAYFKNIQ